MKLKKELMHHSKIKLIPMKKKFSKGDVNGRKNTVREDFGQVERNFRTFQAQLMHLKLKVSKRNVDLYGIKKLYYLRLAV